MHTRFAKSLILLEILAVVAVLVLSTSPPRMRSSGIDLDQAIIDPSRLTIRVNQRIKTVAGPNISISPNVKYTISSAGDAIFIDFEEPLASATQYSVDIDDITSENTSKKVSKTIQFTTPSYDFAYIKRGVGYDESVPLGMAYAKKNSDKVILKTLGDNKERILYESDKIDEIEPVGNQVAVSEVIGENRHRLLLIDKKGKVTEIITSPDVTISTLRASNDGLLLGYLSVDQTVELIEQTKVLKFYDVQAGITFGLNENNGGSNSVYDWAFSPDSSLVSTLGSDGNLFITPVDESDGPSLYGRFDSISGFSHDGNFLFVAVSGLAKQINISTGSLETVSNNSTSNIGNYSFVLTPKKSSQGFLADSATYSDDSNNFVSSVSLISSDGRASELFRTNTIKVSILDVSPSPNDQYALVETSSVHEAIYDDYPSVRKPNNVITRIIDVSSAREIEQIEGFDLSIFRN